MIEYKVLAEGWLADGCGIAAYRAVGDKVKLSTTQAEYLRMAGIIEPWSQLVFANQTAGEKSKPAGK